MAIREQEQPEPPTEPEPPPQPEPEPGGPPDDGNGGEGPATHNALFIGTFQ